MREAVRASRFSKPVFFPGAASRANDVGQSRRALPGLPNMQAPARCFIHSSARNRIATQAAESSATVTGLVAAYSFHTAAAVHSAPPGLYSRTMGDETRWPSQYPKQSQCSTPTLLAATGCHSRSVHVGKYTHGRLHGGFVPFDVFLCFTGPFIFSPGSLHPVSLIICFLPHLY